MEDQKNQQMLVQDHSHKWHYTAIVFFGGVTAILLIVVALLLSKYSHFQRQVYQTPMSQSTQQQSTVQAQVQQVSPEPINSNSDLNTALQTLDTTDTSQVNSGLNQNSQDSSSFSQ